MMKRKIIISFSIIFLVIIGLLMNSEDCNVYAATSTLTYKTHVENIGWQGWKNEGEMSGTSGQALRLEAIQINNTNSNYKLKYQVHVQDIGWQGWKNQGEIAGTSGRALRLEAIQIQLENSELYDVMYRVHVENIGWQGWKKNGELAGTTGQSLRLEAIEIKVVAKPGANTLNTLYTSHIENIGWENTWHINGEASGTTGQALRIEAMKIKLINAPSDAQIQYSGYIQNNGWSSWKKNGEIVGTSGQALRIEALKIKLVNLNDYNVKYRAHIQNIGWTSWKQDGEAVGTEKSGLRIEAIEIKLEKKPAYLTGIEITTKPNKISYKYGENLDLTGMVVKSVMNTGTKTQISSNNYTVTGYNKTKLGEQTITVTYQGKTATFKVTVNNYIKDIELQSKPTKVSYVEGNNLDTTGMNVNAIMADNTKQKINLTDSKLSITPKTNLSTATNKIVVKYQTTNTIDGKNKEFVKEFNISVIKKFGSLIINKEKDNGYAHEQFTYGTIKEGLNEEALVVSNLKYQVKNSLQEDVTNTDVIVKFEKTDKTYIKVLANKKGIYTITPYVGNSITDQNAVVANSFTVQITDNPIIDSAELIDITSSKVRIDKTIQKDLVFKNAHGDILENIPANNIEVISNSKTDLNLITEKINNIDVAKSLKIKGKEEGNQSLQIKVNTQDSSKTKTITLGNVTVIERSEKTIDVNNITRINLLINEPLISQKDIVVKNNKIYTLFDIKLIDKDDDSDVFINANDVIIGTSTESNKLIVAYTNYSSSNPLVDIQLFDEDGNIINNNSTNQINYIGVSLNSNVKESDLKNKQLTLKYNNSNVNLDITVEDISIKELIVTPENVSVLTQLPEVTNHEKTTIGTIKSGIGQESLQISQLKYRVEDEEGIDITNSLMPDQTKKVLVEFEEELARPGEILINVTTQEEGKYTIIPYIEVNENEIKTSQGIESNNDPIVASVTIDNIKTQDLVQNQIFEDLIVFKNKYFDILTNVKANSISASGQDLDITLLNNGSPFTNPEYTVTGIEITPNTVGNKTLTIIVNKDTVNERQFEFKFNVIAPNIELSLGKTEISVYEQEPIETVYEIANIEGVIYTLVPISLTNTTTTIKGNDIALGNLSYSFSNDDSWSIDLQLFDENKIITNTGNIVKYVGIALGAGYEAYELDDVEISLTYGTSTKTITINN